MSPIIKIQATLVFVGEKPEIEKYEKINHSFNGVPYQIIFENLRYIGRSQFMGFISVLSEGQELNNDQAFEIIRRAGAELLNSSIVSLSDVKLV